MERTYNVFVDNGLFFLANYLDKDIEDITIDDLKNNVFYFEEKYKAVEEKTLYKKMGSMCFQNSIYTQTRAKDTISEKLSKILGEAGDEEYCSICGKKHMRNEGYSKDVLGAITRSYMPLLSTNTFFNFSNNLQKINVCPICIVLSLISIFNTKIVRIKAKNSDKGTVTDSCLLTISDDDEYMLETTYKIQEENKVLEILKTSNKDTPSINTMLKQTILDREIFNGYIEMVAFKNSAQQEQLERNFLSKRKLRFIKNIINKSLMQEFEAVGLMNSIINENFERDYLAYIVNKKDFTYKVSRELREEIIKEFEIMKREKLEMIKSVVQTVWSCDRIKDPIRDLKATENLTQFENTVYHWIEKAGIRIELEDFEGLISYKSFKKTRLLMLIELNNLKK